MPAIQINSLAKSFGDKLFSKVYARSAQTLMRLRRKKEENELLENALRIHPQEPDYWLCAIQVWIEENEREKAYKTYLQVSGEFERIPYFRLLELYFLNEQKKFKEVTHAVKVLVAETTEFPPEVFLEAAYAHRKLNQKTEGEEYLRWYYCIQCCYGICEAPVPVDSLGNKILLGFGVKQMASFGNEVYRWSDRYSFYYLLQAYKRHGINEAVQFVQSEVAKHPESTYILWRVGRFYSTEGYYEKALPLYEKLLLLDPKESKSIQKRINEIRQKLKETTKS